MGPSKLNIEFKKEKSINWRLLIEPEVLSNQQMMQI